MTKKIISLVIPAYMEWNNISFIYKEITLIFDKLDYDYEIIFVNDGSLDNTWEEIKKITKIDKKIKAIDLSRNFWKEISISAWIDLAVWDAVITIDSDWQHPIEKIPDFLHYWELGFDIVYNKRPKTKWISFLKRFSSKIFYAIFNLISEFKLEPWTTDYRLLDRKVVDYYIKFWEKNRLYRWLTDWLGFNKKALIFDANKRYNWWKWSYSYSNLFNLAVNSLTSFSLFPLKLVWYIWTLITLSSVILFFVIIFDKFSLNYFNFSNLAIIVVLNTILMWIIMISLWFIALYIGKIHEEVLGRPMYIIKDKQNIK